RHEESGRPADVGCRHRGAVHPLAATAPDRRGDLLARREDVRLAPAVSGWAAAGKIAHTVSVRITAMRRADGDYPIGVAWIRDADRPVAGSEALLGSGALEAGIAGRRHHHRTSADEVVARLADRSLPAREAVDVVGQREREVDAVHHGVGAVS